MDAPLPETVDVKPLPGDGFQTAFQTRCPECRSWVRAVFKREKRQEDPFLEQPCPHCGTDLSLVVNRALSDERLEQLRQHPYHLRDIT